MRRASVKIPSAKPAADPSPEGTQRVAGGEFSGDFGSCWLETRR